MICHERTVQIRSAETHLPVLEDEAQALSERRLVPLVSDTGCVTGDAPGSEPFLLLGKVASSGRGRRQHEEDNDAHDHGDDSLEDDCDVRLIAEMSTMISQSHRQPASPPLPFMPEMMAAARIEPKPLDRLLPEYMMAMRRASSLRV